MNITNETLAVLRDAAQAVSRNAYAPYSNFPVGAAVLAANGKVYTGVYQFRHTGNCFRLTVSQPRSG